MTIFMITTCLLLVAVLVLVAYGKMLMVKMIKIRSEKEYMEHDLHELSMLSGREDLPVKRPYLRNPEAIKISFDIIRLRLHGAQLKNDLKNLGRVEE